MPDLVRFAREHAVCWEIAPHCELKEARLLKVGFDLTLHAQAPHVDAGSAAALEIHAALRDIAAAALPRGIRYEVEPYDASLRFRRETGWAPEVDLTVEIRHREGTFDVVDETERMSAQAIGRSLTRLGIAEGVCRLRHAA